MSTITLQPASVLRAKVRRAAGSKNLQTDLRRARALAKLLDSQFQVGGIRFGLEGILGLVPVLGDTVGALAGLYPVWVANRHKLGRGVQARMAANLLAEWGVGLVPWVGDLLDVALKANLRNVRLLEKAAAKADRR
jgi:hypothetical protein